MPDFSSSFINPYQFLSPEKPRHAISRKDARRTLLPHDPGTRTDNDEEQRQSADHLRHDVYGTGLHSGRIICRMTTETPCVFGNEHVGRDPVRTKDWGSIVRNLCMQDHLGRTVPAAAGTSLKGMISHLIEACSGSAMRVQANTAMSYRSNYREETRVAIGMIIEVDEQQGDGTNRKKRKLLPLTLPRLRLFEPGNDVQNEHDAGFEFDQHFLSLTRKETFPWMQYLTSGHWNHPTCVLQNLPFYVRGYRRKQKHNRPGYEDHTLQAPNAVPEGLLADNTLSWGHRNQKSYWVIDQEPCLPLVTCIAKGTHSGNDEWHLGVCSPESNTNERLRTFLKLRGNTPLTRQVGPRVLDAGDAREVQRDELSELLGNSYEPTIGILRRLSEPKDASRESLRCVSGKYHEMLIPVNGFFKDGFFPWDPDAPDSLKEGLLDVESPATAFERQARELAALYDDSRPFRLRDTEERNQRFEKLRLRHGDLVHFRLKPAEPFERVSEPTDEQFADVPVEVESVAISSIWRENAQDVHTFLRSAEDWEQRPMSKSRTTITLAEAMFGFVDGKENNTRQGDENGEDFVTGENAGPKSEGLNTLAGRLQFSAALLSPEHSEEVDPKDYKPLQSTLATEGIGNLIEVPSVAAGGPAEKLFPLRILSSPKLPCPEMYFQFPLDVFPDTMRSTQRTAGAQLAQWLRATPEEREKRNLKPPDNVPRPRGFKWYVHDYSACTLMNNAGQLRYSWQTSDTGSGRDSTKKQKTLVQPLKPGQTFFFHIDFFNLTDAELKMLKFVLRPSSGFRHKLGFAKPLGLGSVRIDPVALFNVNRRDRYKQQQQFLGAARSERFHQIELWPDSAVQAVDLLPPRYLREAAALQQAGTRTVKTVWGTKDRSPFADFVSDSFWRQLEVLGNPAYVDSLRQDGAVVSYPMRRNQKADWADGKDVESFKWFPGGGGPAQALKTLHPMAGEPILPLDELAKNLLLPIP